MGVYNKAFLFLSVLLIQCCRLLLYLITFSVSRILSMFNPLFLVNRIFFLLTFLLHNAFHFLFHNFVLVCHFCSPSFMVFWFFKGYIISLARFILYALFIGPPLVRFLSFALLMLFLHFIPPSQTRSEAENIKATEEHETKLRRHHRLKAKKPMPMKTPKNRIERIYIKVHKSGTAKKNEVV